MKMMTYHEMINSSNVRMSLNQLGVELDRQIVVLNNGKGKKRDITIEASMSALFHHGM